MPDRNDTPSPEPSGPSPAERRAYVRVASDLAVTCSPTGRRRDVSWPGRVKDISRGGVGLLMRHRFRPGSRLSVELRSISGTILRTVEVRVIHATAVLVQGNHCWLLGCAFDEPLGDDEVQALR